MMSVPRMNSLNYDNAANVMENDNSALAYKMLPFLINHAVPNQAVGFKLLCSLESYLKVRDRVLCSEIFILILGGI